MKRWLLLVGLAVGLGAQEARVVADRLYVTALTAYQQAEIDDSQDDAVSARRHLIEAKTARDAALVAYRALPRQLDADVVDKREIELDRLGKVCCGRTSLWDRYAQ